MFMTVYIAYIWNDILHYILTKQQPALNVCHRGNQQANLPDAYQIGLFDVLPHIRACFIIQWDFMSQNLMKIWILEKVR